MSALLLGSVLLLQAAAVAPARPHGDPISEGLASLRSLKPDKRAEETERLAQMIRKLHAGQEKVQYAYALSNLSTEGDCGHQTLQDVADALAEAVTQSSPPSNGPYQELAQLARYEDIKVDLKAQGYKSAMDSLISLEKVRAKVDFTLTDLAGRQWTLSKLKGKVVVVNFWATWCPPCRAEMPDLQALYTELGKKGLVVLAVSDEKRDVVEKFLATKSYTFPILLDEGRKVNMAYQIAGIPNSYVYNRQGKLVAVGIDGRTRKQFLRLLSKAGLTE